MNNRYLLFYTLMFLYSSLQAMQDRVQINAISNEDILHAIEHDNDRMIQTLLTSGKITPNTIIYDKNNKRIHIGILAYKLHKEKILACFFDKENYTTFDNDDNDEEDDASAYNCLTRFIKTMIIILNFFSSSKTK